METKLHLGGIKQSSNFLLLHTASLPPEEYKGSVIGCIKTNTTLHTQNPNLALIVGVTYATSNKGACVNVLIS